MGKVESIADHWTASQHASRIRKTLSPVRRKRASAMMVGQSYAAAAMRPVVRPAVRPVRSASARRAGGAGRGEQTLRLVAKRRSPEASGWGSGRRNLLVDGAYLLIAVGAAAVFWWSTR